MGTWGVHSFENDDAKEWCQAYREMGLFVAKSTLDVALGDLRNSGLSADVASRAVAAVEAVAFALGRGTRASIEAFAGAPEADRAEAEALVETAVETVDAIVGGSQLNTLWTEAGPSEHESWVAAMTALKSRVQGQADRPVRQAIEDMPQQAPQHAQASDMTSDDVAELRASVDQLGTELQAMRQEMRDALVELARQIAGRKG